MNGDMAEADCTCVPQVFRHQHHREGVLVAWFWPDSPMWLQPAFGVPIEVTSSDFATTVELGWTRLSVNPGTTGLWIETPTGPAYFELIR